MNIKQIIDKALKEADVQAQDWPVSNRLEDVNMEYLMRVEKTVQIGSKSPASKSEAVSENFTVVAGSNTFTRTIKDVPIVRVDFKHSGADRFEKVDEDNSRMINGYCLGDQTFFTNEKQVFVENGYAGTLRVTYARGSVVTFTQADYDNATPPSPDWLPEVFHPLLWLAPAMTQAGYYKKDRYAVLQAQFERLDTLFDNHYGRDAIVDGEIRTDEDECSCFGSGKSRR